MINTAHIERVIRIAILLAILAGAAVTIAAVVML